MTTIHICSYPFSKDTSLLATGMDFAHRYINMRRLVYVYIIIYKYISYFIKWEGRKLTSKLFNESFVSFSLRIGATRILACPSFVHCNWRNRSVRHRRQPVTLLWGEKWKLRSERRQWKRFFYLAIWLGCLV